MKRRTMLFVLAAAVLMVGAAIVLPALFVKREPPTNLPWQVEATPSGGLRVFGLTVGESTLADAERLYHEGNVTLFRSPQGKIGVEAFFENVNLSGLSAKVVLGLRVPADELAAMYERGVRASKLASGTQKVSLTSEDRRRMDQAVIDTLTYMPSINLAEPLVEKRFGVAAEKWKEPATGVVHWLYPRIGLDVAFSESEKEVLQYVPPAEFARLRDPLVSGERLP
jgi:hypothetical protein